MATVLYDKNGKEIKHGDIIVYYTDYLSINKEIRKEFKGIPYVCKIVSGVYYLFWKDHYYDIKLDCNEDYILFNSTNWKVIGNVKQRKNNYREISGYDLVDNEIEYEQLHIANREKYQEHINEKHSASIKK